MDLVPKIVLNFDCNEEDDLHWQIVDFCIILQKKGEAYEFLSKFSYESRVRIKYFYDKRFKILTHSFPNYVPSAHYRMVLNYIIFSGKEFFYNINEFKFLILYNCQLESTGSICLFEIFNLIIKSVELDYRQLICCAKSKLQSFVEESNRNGMII